jgi:hypothetical protein
MVLSHAKFRWNFGGAGFIPGVLTQSPTYVHFQSAQGYAAIPHKWLGLRDIVPYGLIGEK